MKFQRDAFIEVLTDAAKKDKNIYLLSADFGAPALDRFREEIPDQFIHCGISEQNMIDVAAGLALDGRRVFCYAMAPFVTLRCLEQHKCSSAIMKLPICTIVAGVGLGYADAGPTHYATEDLACLRAIVGSTVLTASDADNARLLAEDALNRPRFSFIRLDRAALKTHGHTSANDVFNGYRLIGPGRQLAIVTNGSMVGKTLEAIESLDDVDEEITVIDLFQVKPFSKMLAAKLSFFRRVLVIEEQTPCGGMFGAVLEALANFGAFIPVEHLCLPERYFFENGGRDKLLSIAGLGQEDIADKIKRCLV